MLCNSPMGRAPVWWPGQPLALPYKEPTALPSSSVTLSSQCWAAVSVLGTTLLWRPLAGFASLAASRQSPWRRVETTNKPKSLPSSLNVLSASRKGHRQPLSCCPMTLKCFKQNRVDGGVLLRQLQGRGCQLGSSGRAQLGVGDRQDQGRPASGSPRACRDRDQVGEKLLPYRKQVEARQEAAKTPGE